MDIAEELRQDREKGARRLESEYKAGMMTLARRFCADEGDAEELVNRTFAAVVDGIDGYLEQSAFFAWMCQIMSNLHSMECRRKSHQMEVFPGVMPDVADEAAREAIYNSLDATIVREALKSLPPDQRESLILYYFFDMPVAKIAKFLAIPAGTVRSRLHYARKALAAKLGAAAKKPGGKALLLALALCGLTALGAAVALVGDAAFSRVRRDEQTQDVAGQGGGDLQIAVYNSGGGPDSASPAPTFDFGRPTFDQPPQQETTMNATKLLAGPLAALALVAPTTNLADTPSSDTIAYWPFGENGFSDVSGNGHDLSPNGTLAASDAAYMTLNGTSDYLTTASTLDLSGETAVTFECWTRSTGKHGTVDALFSSVNPGSNAAGSWVLYYTGKLQAQFSMGSGWHIDYTSSTSAMDDGMWHHVAYVVNRSNTGSSVATLYLDGVPVTHADSPAGSAPSFLNETFFIGGGSKYCENANFYTGYIDDVRISRGALTPDQFLKYPSVGKTMRANDGKLPVVAYWPFGGKGGKDATGNGFDLAISGVPMISGTPSPDYYNYAKTNYYNGTFPFSAFSKTGLTIECYAKTGSSGGGMSGSLLETSTLYYNNTGAFQLRFEASSSYKTATAYFLASGKEGASPKYVRSPTSEDLFGALNDNRWRHYAIVYDPSKTGAGIVTLYVDGVAAPVSADNADQGAFALRDDKLYLARRDIGSDRGGAPFYGSMDDVRITAGVLTPDQFLPARSAGSTVALYRFDRETIEDQSGNENDLIHMHTESTVADPVFGDAGFPDSGTGLVLSGTEDKSGNIGTRDWVKTASPIDFSESKAFTVEFDYNSNDPSETVIPSGKTDKPVYVLAASTQVATRGGFVVYRPGSTLQGQFRTNTGSGWLKYYFQNFGDMKDGYRRGRYSVNGKNTGYVYFNLVVDGTANSQSSAVDYGSFGSHVIGFGHCPSYYADATTPYYMKGKLLRAAISDIALDPADYVLDNLVLDTAKATLAYWSFAGDTGLLPTGAPRRNGALDLDGSSSASTTNLLLSTLTQATIECFVCFGATPSSGTLFSMGTGAGSFAVASDATAGTLSGSFIPYDHLAASNGGATPLAPLAGKKVWHHVALVIDRTKPGADAVRFYVDYERTTPAGRAWDAAATMLDGAISIGDGFTGWIDDLRVSAGALAPTEFLQPDMRTETPDAFTIVIR